MRAGVDRLFDHVDKLNVTLDNGMGLRGDIDASTLLDELLRPTASWPRAWRRHEAQVLEVTARLYRVEIRRLRTVSPELAYQLGMRAMKLPLADLPATVHVALVNDVMSTCVGRRPPDLVLLKRLLHHYRGHPGWNSPGIALEYLGRLEEFMVLTGDRDIALFHYLSSVRSRSADIDPPSLAAARMAGAASIVSTTSRPNFALAFELLEGASKSLSEHRTITGSEHVLFAGTIEVHTGLVLLRSNDDGGEKFIDQGLSKIERTNGIARVVFPNLWTDGVFDPYRHLDAP